MSVKKKVLKKVKPAHSGGERENDKDTSGGESSEFECEVSSSQTQTETNTGTQDRQTNQVDEVQKQVNLETVTDTSSSLSNEIETSSCLRPVPAIDNRTINFSTEQQQSILETVESFEYDTPPSPTTSSEPKSNPSTIENKDELEFANRTQTSDTQTKEQRSVPPIDEDQSATMDTDGQCVPPSLTVTVVCQQEKIITIDTEHDCSAGSVAIHSTSNSASSPGDNDSLSAHGDCSTNVPQCSKDSNPNDLYHLSDDLQLPGADDFPVPDSEKKESLLPNTSEDSSSLVTRDSESEPLTLEIATEDITTDQTISPPTEIEGENVPHAPMHTLELFQAETFQPIPLKDLATALLDNESMPTEGICNEMIDSNVATQDESIKIRQTPPNISSPLVASESTNSEDVDSVSIDISVEKQFTKAITETDGRHDDQKLVPTTPELIMHTTDDAAAKHPSSSPVTEPLVIEHPHKAPQPESESKSPDASIEPISTTDTAVDSRQSVDPEHMHCTHGNDIETESITDTAFSTNEAITVETDLNGDNRSDKVVDMVIESSILTTTASTDREE